jgi:predicted amidohydrolase
MKKKLIVIILFALASYFVWAYTGRYAKDNEPTVDLKLGEISAVGIDSAKGNIVGIQPYMVENDYANANNFFQKLDAYFAKAQAQGFFTNKTVVVLPEYIGTWLVVANEKNSIYSAPTIAEGMTTLVLANLFSFIPNYWNAPEVSDKLKYAIFKMKAKQMANIYHATFFDLANKYKVDIVAGSIVLPYPQIADNQITVSGDSLYNISIVYHKEREKPPQIVRKVYPIVEELSFTHACAVSEIPVFDLSIGRTGVLICADSWHPTAYKILKKQGANIILVPSYSSPAGIWTTQWNGYNGTEPPQDVDLEDIKKITEGEAWLKYALAGRIKATDAQYGFNVFLRGKFWDLGADGYALIVRKGELTKGKPIEGASIICLWL